MKIKRLSKIEKQLLESNEADLYEIFLIRNEDNFYEEYMNNGAYYEGVSFEDFCERKYELDKLETNIK